MQTMGVLALFLEVPCKQIGPFNSRPLGLWWLRVRLLTSVHGGLQVLAFG